MPGTLDAFDRLDDKWSGDLIDLTAAQWANDVSLHASLFILIRHDAAALEVFPQRPSIAQSVATRRLLTEFLSLASGDLASLHETHLWPVAKCDVGDATAM